MADLADHAFAHTVAVLGPGDPALEAAITAVRRGGRSRTAVLGHARAEALARAAETPVADLDQPVPDDLAALAAVLAATRPPVERAVVDLEGRHDLERPAFGRALGTSTARAATRAAEVGATWERSLDPVLLARLGPAGCDGMAAALGAALGGAARSAGTGELDAAEVVADDGDGAEAPVVPRSLRDLLMLGPAVSDHAAGCESCADRLRSMVSVRTLLAQRPLDRAPGPVRAAAAPSRLRRPAPPPPLEVEPAALRWLRPAVAMGLAAVLAIGGGVIAAARRADPGTGTVEALTRVPPSGSALLAEPTAVAGQAPEPIRLTNRSSTPIVWTAAADAPWLLVTPPEGRLAPGRSTALRLRVTGDVPEGDVRGAVQITGGDGSATLVRLTATIERPPDVAATATGCTVEAVVEDEGAVAGAELHWVEAGAPGGRPAERMEAMQATSTGFVGRLPNDPGGSVTWWVSAADARGNRARTQDQVLAAGTCPSP